MLRITVQEDAKEHVIRLEGKIVGPWVEEFARTWRSLGRAEAKICISICEAWLL
jgi:hypothetical protein